MAEKKPTIVIKKITVVAGGAHGGAWKVAFADFMTAMMAFFLVMWLVASASEDQKKAISDYFSTPSIIEYQFNNLGAELTLEKLFLDLVNEPLKVFQVFVTPIDRTPNIMAMGMKKIVMAHMAEQLGAVASSVDITADSVVFEIPDNFMFEKGSATPNGEFVNVMERVKGVTIGLEDSNVTITSVVFKQAMAGDNVRQARNVAEERLDLIQTKVKSSLENDSVDVLGQAFAGDEERRPPEKRASVISGYLRIEIKQKDRLSDGSKPREISDGIFGSSDSDNTIYEGFVDRLSKSKRQ